MPSSPLPQTPPDRANGQVSPLATLVGALVVAFGACLAALTLAGAISGYDAIGFFDLTVGAMFLLFSWQCAKFGLDVTAGRQTLTGNAIR